MKTKKLADRQLHKKSDLNKTTMVEMMTSLLGTSNTEKSEFLSPERQPDGRYITSKENLNKKIDPRIFRETQIKRLLRWLTATPPLFRIFFKWLLVKKLKMKLDYFSDNERKKSDNIFKNKNSDEHKIEAAVTNGLKIHNLGHATQLIQTEGLNILTDPVFGHLAPIFYPSMTKKFNREIRPEELPKIDVILISHNHRDHVDESSLKKIIRQGNQPTLLVPMGDASYFKSLGFKNVQELEWHEEVTLQSETTKRKVAICSAPADHRSGRKGYDSHKSLVSGWIISPKARNEIVYFAGDTSRLNETRMLALALDIYALYKHKKVDSHLLPQIINMSPGGPNYTRQDMQPTHQSAVDSIASAFRLAIKLAEVSKKDNENTSAEQWLAQTATIFMHHNKFELGPDRFNENIFIYNRLCSYLKMSNDAFVAQSRKQNNKSKGWSIFHRRKDFIINGVIELRSLAESIWPDDSIESRNNKLIAFIETHTHFPLINEKLGSQQFFQFKSGSVSTIRPTTEKGSKPRIK